MLYHTPIWYFLAIGHMHTLQDDVLLPINPSQLKNMGIAYHGIWKRISATKTSQNIGEEPQFAASIKQLLR